MPILVLPFRKSWNACNLFHCLQSDWISSLPVIFPPSGEYTMVMILSCSNMLTGDFGQSSVYFETVSFLGQEMKLCDKVNLCVLGVFAKLQSVYQLRPVCLSVCPSARNNSAPNEWIFMKFDICVFFENLSRKVQFH